MIAICPNPYRDHELRLSRDCMRLLQEAGFDCVLCPVFSESEPEIIPEELHPQSLDSLGENCSLAVVIGGDGTMLTVASALYGREIPLLGVNLGTKGFMASIEPDNIATVLEAACGRCAISRRMMLELTLQRNGETMFHGNALNDAVIHGYGECVNITAWCNGQKMTGFNGDGVILSTPTGSTGYSMSAGGPIVEPDAENIILSPICAHALGARTFVLGPDREIRVCTEKSYGRRAYLSVDGNFSADVNSGDILIARRSQHQVLMADPGVKSFYEIAFEKLR